MNFEGKVDLEGNVMLGDRKNIDTIHTLSGEMLRIFVSRHQSSPTVRVDDISSLCLGGLASWDYNQRYYNQRYYNE